ncbi:trypsin, alkaline C-like [Ostrinia furnacalis]|uniref:trypsin, alkaline C-like n=1 Tax=Ostrinia furnacalis TaxID=93504 RepID=UPI00103CD3B8|nr:trypsin, alkaline C-like [Ostrinia furnacalis]
MHALVVLLMGLAAVSADAPAPVIQRIVGGSLTTINQYPEMAALLFSSSGFGHQQGCGGTILNNRAILTAAHCTIGHTIARWRARVGSNFANREGTEINTAQIINHPSYNPWTYDNDISILRMASTIPIGSNTVQAGRIAGATYNLADSQVVWAAGWGRTSANGQASEQLRHVQIWTINQAICRQRYATVGDTITDNMLCSGWLDVGGRDQCQGDSGGPLYHNGVVVGVCSWGRGCASPFFPGVNARVSRYTNWITQNA